MKTIFALCGITLLAGGFFLWRSLREPTVFGTFTNAPVVSVADLIERPKDFLGKNVTVNGPIAEQCKAMGCFFFLHAGQKSLRIELQEIAMTAPRREGRDARIEGQIVTYSDGYQLLASGIEFK